LKFSNEQLTQLDNTIKDLRIAIKNSILYTPNHPISNYSINNLKTSLEKWFLSQESLELGISQNHLFCDGESIREKDITYGEVAQFFHNRGLISVSFMKGIDVDELRQFLHFIKQNRKTILEKGGIRKNLPESNHIKIKEIDYSALLQSTKDENATEESKVWKFLLNVSRESKAGELPKSKLEFLLDFFKDTQRSVRTLNRVYREATATMTDEEAAKSIRETILQICQYLEKASTTDAKDLKVQLMNVIAQLHPDLINMLFDQTVGSEENMDLVETITKDFSEDYIADFIESLISNEDTFNENLLKVFDKLAPGPSKANNVVSMVADKLFNKRVLSPDTMTQLQMSIMEIFKKHPDSDFMNQIYKITVDSVMNKKIDTLVYMSRLTPLINKFVQSMEDEQLKKEKIWLLLNILWLENNPTEFRRFADRLQGVLPELLDTKDTGRLREIVEFFSEKIRPEQMRDRQMAAAIRDSLGKIMNKKTINSLITILPELGQQELEDVVYILLHSESECIKTLIDAFLTDKNPAHRNKFWFVFLRMKGEVSREAVNRLEYADPVVVKDLFHILKECDAAKARLAAKKFIVHKVAQVRWEALDIFEPESEEERNDVFRLFRKEKNKSVKKKAALVLLKTEDTATIDRLFRSSEREFLRPKFLQDLVELSGHVRAQAALPHLKRIFLKRTFFHTRRREELRVAVLTATGRLKTEEALKLIRIGLQDKSRRVREMAEIILKLDE
jgi:HEAT repeat protein/F0F1-type ATP synthase delta subunit